MNPSKPSPWPVIGPINRKTNYVLGVGRETPRISRLPRQISYWLGYRDKNSKPLIRKWPEWARLIQVLVTTFTSLIIQAVINKYGYPFKQWNTPALIPSFGASAVLCFNAIGTPLAQPRNLIMGSVIASFVGIVLMKFWMEDPNEQYLWIGAPLACAITSVLLSMFGCIHPPVGATAMLPLLDDQIRALGWKYMVVELTGCAVFLVCSLIFNNISARYPTYWWTPTPTRPEPKIPMVEITANTVNTSVQGNEEFQKHVRALQVYLQTSADLE